MIQTNVINSSYIHNVKKLLFLGSSCIYPKFSEQPIKENQLLKGYLEPTNKPYAVAKIAGIEMCESYRRQYSCNFISAMPTNIYGINDNYHELDSHVIPALIKKFTQAKFKNTPKVKVWGSGKIFREFLHSDDLADACVFLLKNYNSLDTINIGSGEDIRIENLVKLICEIIDYKGNIVWDKSKPDGTPRKLLCVNKINSLGWKYKINLNKGLKSVINNYIEKHGDKL